MASKDVSMDLTRGNAVFLVQGVLFCSIPLYQIPKALLQLHSQAFKDMLEGSQGPDEEPIQLEDELEAFRDLCATLMTPFASCLNTTLPMAKDMKRLMNLAIILHKYQMHEYETHVVHLLQPLTQVTTLQPLLSTDFTLADILRIADRIDCSSLAEAARTMLLDQIWSRKASMEPLAIVRLGQEIRDKLIIGAGLYQVLLLGREAWPKLDLTDAESSALLNGMHRCGDLKESLTNSLGSGPATSGRDKFLHKCCFNATEAFPTVSLLYTVQPSTISYSASTFSPTLVEQPSSWRRIQKVLFGMSSHKLKWYDIVGFMQLIANSGCKSSSCPALYQQEILAFKTALYSIFYPEPITHYLTT